MRAANTMLTLLCFVFYSSIIIINIHPCKSFLFESAFVSVFFHSSTECFHSTAFCAKEQTSIVRRTDINPFVFSLYSLQIDRMEPTKSEHKRKRAPLITTPNIRMFFVQNEQLVTAKRQRAANSPNMHFLHFYSVHLRVFSLFILVVVMGLEVRV